VPTQVTLVCYVVSTTYYQGDNEYDLLVGGGYIPDYYVLFDPQGSLVASSAGIPKC
jgi:hypothetical protein